MCLGQSRRAAPSWPASEPPPPLNSACWTIRADTTALHRPLTCGNCPVIQDLHDLRGTSPILGTAAMGEAAVGTQPCLPPYGAPGVPAAVQAGPCRVPLDPGKVAHRLARAGIYPSCTHDGHGRAEPLTAQ